MDNAKLGFVEGIEVVDGKDDSVRTVTRIIINVQRELGKQMYDRPVIILTVEEWDALQAERGMLQKAVSMLNCMVRGGESHSASSKAQVEAALSGEESK